MKRKRVKESSSFYFADEAQVEFFPSGCMVLDCVLGGGWALGGVVNLVGDKSTGKTLIAIEAAANFRKSFPNAPIIYDICGGETFDRNYAIFLGLPVDGIEITASVTVEEMYDKLNDLLKTQKKNPSLYILDSLDALSDDAEQKRKITDGTFGTKAKKIGEMFRRLDSKLSQKKCLLFVVSQIRDNIGVTFGRKHKRSGGKALDFYAQQVIWLAEVKKLHKTKNKVRRVIGVQLKVKNEKNKVGLPYRECELPIIFNYGMDDDTASQDFLDSIGDKKSVSGERLAERVKKKWLDIEKDFMPTKRKYD